MTSYGKSMFPNDYLAAQKETRMTDTFASSDLPEPDTARPGGMMSEELSEALRLCAVLRGRPQRNAYDWDAAATIERLLRERDEALAEAAEYKRALTATHQARVEGEKQARAKAIDEAADVVEQFHYAPEILDAILALKDKQ